MDKEKTIADFELENGVALKDTGKYPADSTVTEAEFKSTIDDGESYKDYVRVEIPYRIFWLLQNGYELTRENMIDVDLPSRPELHAKNVDRIPKEIAEFNVTPELYKELVA